MNNSFERCRNQPKDNDWPQGFFEIQWNVFTMISTENVKFKRFSKNLNEHHKT